MFIAGMFLLLTYLICSVQFKELVKYKNYNNIGVKIVTAIVNKIKIEHPKFSFVYTLSIIDHIKCPLFVACSAFLFHEKYIIDITAIVSHTAHYLPMVSNCKNNSKNFVSLMLTSFILNPITGISMFVSFFIVANNKGHFATAITSAVIVGILKTLINISFLGNKDYIEMLFVVAFGMLAIYRNKRTLIYICAKANPKKNIESIFRKKTEKKKIDINNVNNGSINNVDKHEEKACSNTNINDKMHCMYNNCSNRKNYLFNEKKLKHKKRIQEAVSVKGVIYKKYKSVYKNNHIYDICNKKYGKDDFNYIKPNKIVLNNMQDSNIVT